jgi:cellulose synthase (UDP-forming)
MSWRNFYEYLAGTMWWLEGLATMAVFAIPIAVLVSGAHTSTAPPAVFAAAFVAMFATRLWGCKRLMRGHIRWSTAFALRVFRVPVGLACVWWLISRKTLQFEVTPKGASDQRLRGRAPRVLWVLLATATVVLAYSVAGVIGIVPWSSDASSTTASGVWLAMAGGVLVAGTIRIRAVEFATSRRNAHRVAISAPVTVDGVSGELLDISVGGAGVRLPTGLVPTTGLVELALPGAASIKLEIARISTGQRADADASYEFASLRVGDRDWAAYAALSRWMFHTPDGAVPGLPPGVPLVGCKRSAGRG